MRYFLILTTIGALLLALRGAAALRGKPSPFIGVVLGVFVGGVVGSAVGSMPAAITVGGLVALYGWTGGGEDA
jgi:hypothetical protein